MENLEKGSPEWRAIVGGLSGADSLSVWNFIEVYSHIKMSELISKDGAKKQK